MDEILGIVDFDGGIFSWQIQEIHKFLRQSVKIILVVTQNRPQIQIWWEMELQTLQIKAAIALLDQPILVFKAFIF